MSLIYDGFASFDKAAGFASRINRDYELNVAVFTDPDEARQVDPFPFDLTGPVVLVDRADEATEQHITMVARQCGGQWAGT